jgi:hypothetical protein
MDRQKDINPLANFTWSYAVCFIYDFWLHLCKYFEWFGATENSIQYINCNDDTFYTNVFFFAIYLKFGLIGISISLVIANVNGLIAAPIELKKLLKDNLSIK